jgi:16S rRNA (cytidine1402-2'-O)-methyltransferase
MNPEERAPLAPMLYLCATPIGNMEDITLRAARVLGAVAAVYCEDTRHTGALLAKLHIKKPLASCRKENEAARAGEIVSRVLMGEAVAYVSDAGMPGVSDPGERIVRACIEAGAPFTVVPGASAMTTALVLSGLPAENACFVGFLPRETKPRREAIERVAKHRGTLIFYESPLLLSRARFPFMYPICLRGQVRDVSVVIPQNYR